MEVSDDVDLFAFFKIAGCNCHPEIWEQRGWGWAINHRWPVDCIEESPEEEPGTKLMLWVVGRYQGESWELQGIYSSEELARQHTESGWFIGPVKLDKPLPLETTSWPFAVIV